MAMKKTRAEMVLEYLVDGRTRSPPEIYKATKVSSLDSLLHYLWKKGLLLASKIVYTYKPIQKKGKWIWSRKRQRFYILRLKKEKEKRAKVVYETFNRRRGCVIRVEKSLFSQLTRKLKT